MTAALIIAAGRRSNRDPFDPGLKVGSISAIKRIVLLFQRSGIRDIAVCGEEEEVKKLLPSMNVVFLPCPAGGEMLHCIQSGIRYLQRKADQILVTHVNSPLFSVQTVSALLCAEGDVCIPACRGRRGHPVLLRSASFGGILEYRGDNGLRSALDSLGIEKNIVEVDDPGILSHLPQPEEEDLILAHDAGKLRLSCKFRIAREEPFLGPGVRQLMALTDELHSLSEACRYMGISYSKGRKIIQTIEQQMKCTVLITQQGGRGGGCSQLTRTAKDLMHRYDAFQQEAEALLGPVFERHFGGISVDAE